MFSHLQWDTDFFGYPVANITADDLNIHELENTISNLKSKGYKLTYARIDPNLKMINEAVVKCGGILYDEKTTYGKQISVSSCESFNNIESYHESIPTSELYAIAEQTGEYSRYKIDNHFTNEQFSKLYHIWIENSVARKNAEEVFVYKLDSLIVGLITLTRHDLDGVISLIGVDSSCRGNKIGKKLILQTEKYFASQHIHYLTVVTQKANTPACLFYENCGFEVIKVENVYHFWL